MARWQLIGNYGTFMLGKGIEEVEPLG